MTVIIEYCGMWNYKPMAVGLAAELQESYQLSCEFIVGSKGIFDVTVDDELIFSKFSLERFPYLGEISQLIKNRETWKYPQIPKALLVLDEISLMDLNKEGTDASRWIYLVLFNAMAS